jgi:hypothetical protein
MASQDQYCLEFDSAVELDTTSTFVCKLDRSLVGFPALQHGAVTIWYSSDNSSWTQWGGIRSHFNGGMSALGSTIYINGNGPAGVTAKYWKFYVVEAPGDSSTVGLTELSATTV